MEIRDHKGDSERMLALNTIYCMDSVEGMKALDDNSIDSCVTDPPYGLEFMGKDWDTFRAKNEIKNCSGIMKDKNFKALPSFSPSQNVKCPDCGKWKWDYPDRKCVCGGADKHAKESFNFAFQQFTYQWATELYRVMKPGAHILIFGGTRTYHRMACAVEDAGFECKNMIMWMYASGFPKSLNIEKEFVKRGNLEMSNRYKGFGTGLKPSFEPVLCAMKPLDTLPILLARKPISERNIASNVLKWGTGGINIDISRVENTGKSTARPRNIAIQGGNYKAGEYVTDGIMAGGHQQGRFPANLILDEEAGRMLDEQSDDCKTGGRHCKTDCGNSIFGKRNINKIMNTDGGTGASRFFYQAKASQAERWFYCTICKEAYPMKERDKHIHNAPEKAKYAHLEFHPTQKPLELIKYLVRLVTPPNGIVIDPFMGTGTTAVACKYQGFRFIGFDSHEPYVQIANARLMQTGLNEWAER